MDHKKIFFLNVLKINFFQIFIGTHYILIILFFPTLHFYLYFFFSFLVEFISISVVYIILSLLYSTILSNPLSDVEKKIQLPSV